ncbi:hypothetical protein DFH09DRAFT_1277937 [Mycena vulgaris]|nr:hypothetical protein DFH09DRAFT_1277937 [Mycena vulgaris]
MPYPDFVSTTSSRPRDSEPRSTRPLTQALPAAQAARAQLPAVVPEDRPPASSSNRGGAQRANGLTFLTSAKSQSTRPVSQAQRAAQAARAHLPVPKTPPPFQQFIYGRYTTFPTGKAKATRPVFQAQLAARSQASTSNSKPTTPSPPKLKSTRPISAQCGGRRPPIPTTPHSRGKDDDEATLPTCNPGIAACNRLCYKSSLGPCVARRSSVLALFGSEAVLYLHSPETSPGSVFQLVFATVLGYVIVTAGAYGTKTAKLADIVGY